MGRVGPSGIGRAQHIDIGQIGIVRLDVALQLAHKRVMWLGGVGERLGRMCWWHRKIMPT